MNIFIRVDSSFEIGTGHVMRCLALAEELKQNGAKVSFISRRFQGNLLHFIRETGFKVCALPPPKQSLFHLDNEVKHSHWLGVAWKTDVAQTKKKLEKSKHIDWLIIDHYSIDKKWESEIRPYVSNIMVIDDLADRPHECELLLDQNLFQDMEKRYEELVPKKSKKLLGPKYALLRKEFREAKNHVKVRDGTVKRVMIFFGGSDPTNETTKCLKAIELLNRSDIIFDVVVGSTNLKKEEVKQMCAVLPNVNYHCQINYMANLMLRADIAIGAGGSTIWERCYLALPTITIITALNQVEVVSAAEEVGIVCNLGYSNIVDSIEIVRKLKCLINNPEKVKEMSKNSLLQTGEKSKMDALTQSIIWESTSMIDLRNFSIKDIQEDQLDLVRNWRNSDAIQPYMYTDHKITELEHKEWFNKVNKDESTIVKLIYYLNKPIGLANFSNINKNNNTCNWGFYIGAQNAPIGSGTILGLLALEYIFKKVGMRKVCGEVLEFNHTSLNFHKKLGFEEEGRFVKHVVKDGEYIDVIALALFIDKWSAVKKNLLFKYRGEANEGT
ncbi:UDP-2,4-diacetamido-2,4,6-trideoxy-beta-L-altropyranose hydrolase [Bacillus sp. FJAT-45350]|uniref:UDP-2,4-diacetamido-2,4, 6-trideoxy-beta-L-altropyranose hydrolase n=1 Tax=Bacillus sp. FJAT-45350 TaxID=2011014 RepID=UPI0011551135|nr:UDP-2,4-diacetamido-2,4,6-trideoxy-beta-L-altropyranose hydrolase [Bacillus sp. FJAT-45350]